MTELLVGKPNIPNIPLFMKRVEEILESKQLTNNGKYVQELEKSIEDYLPVKHCIAVSNATVALELAIESTLGHWRGYGREIIVPSFTFVATVHAIVRNGFKPVFADIDENYCITLEEIAKKKTVNTVGILPCNLFGNVCNLNGIQAFAKNYGLKLIWDNAHALGGCDLNAEEYIGRQSDVGIFSLHATKLINGGEGGLLTTNDDALAKRLRLRRNFGFKPDAGVHGEVISIGTNAKLPEISAALALTGFENIDEIIAHNFDNFNYYKQYLPKEFTMKDKNCYFSNFSYIVIESPAGKRDQVVNFLHKNGVLARIYFQPVHLMRPYMGEKPRFKLENTERISKDIFCLPTGLSIDENAIRQICRLLQESIC